MTALPAQYQWLAQEPGPKMLIEALRLYGTTEKAGPDNNPEILAWAKECGISGYTADSIPWCGLFISICAKRAGKPLALSPLWARSWGMWGQSPLNPGLGDVLVFSRDGGGHVGLYVGEDKTHFHVLGGNQGDAVSIKRIAKNRLITARRMYNTTPKNVRVVRLSDSGEVSTSEA